MAHTEPRLMKIAEVNLIEEDLGIMGIRVTFQMKRKNFEEHFYSQEPWEEWVFAKLMKLCKTTYLRRMVGVKVKLILDLKGRNTSVVALYDEELDTVYPCHSYGVFSMKGYTMSEFLQDWQEE